MEAPNEAQQRREQAVARAALKLTTFLETGLPETALLRDAAADLAEALTVIDHESKGHRAAWRASHG